MDLHLLMRMHYIFTQDETVNADEPVGRLDKRGVEMYDPLATTRAAVGNNDALE
jgi:hypothetical protein